MRKDKIVYMLVDDSSKGNGIFYIGQGTQDRVFDHKKDADAKPNITDDTKVGIINKAGTNLRLVVVRSGLDEKTAREIEAALIDVFNSSYVSLSHGLKNIQTRYGAKSRGLRTIGIVSCNNKWAKLNDVETLLGIKVTNSMLMSSSFGTIIHTKHQIDSSMANKCEYVVLEKADGHILAIYRSRGNWTPEPSNSKGKPMATFSGSVESDPDVLNRLLGRKIPGRKQNCPPVRYIKKEHIDAAKLELRTQKKTTKKP